LARPVLARRSQDFAEVALRWCPPEPAVR